MILLFLPICLMAQFTEYNLLYYDLFCDSPYADIKQTGIGSFNFDKFNLLNNKTYEESKLQISVNFLVDVNSSRLCKESHEIYEIEEYQMFSNDLKISPEFFVRYNINNYSLEIKNYYSKYLNPKQAEGQLYTKINFHISNQVLEFSIIKNINNNIFASAGILTNNFNYSINWTNFNIEALSQTKYFDQFQFTGSFCYLFNSKLRVYFHFKTQKSKVKLSPSKFDLPNISENLIENNTVVSYPGLLAFGVQKTFITNLNISFEVLNHFLFANEHFTIHHLSGIDRTYDYKHSTWNPELALGLNYSKIKNLQFGVQYSRYLKFDNEINGFGGIFQHEYKIHLPQTLILSSLFRFSNKIEISAVYQFSYAKTDYDYGGDTNRYYRDSSHYLKLVLSAFIF
ncbi:MAG: hypothetical protein KAT66_10990 [Candidatus Lokiarchaeota archaeon]|nr:hypothetical protein [Candidatus Lokiarchaeota archaeon]